MLLAMLTHGARVRALTTLYDRQAPHVYKVPAGSVGEVQILWTDGAHFTVARVLFVLEGKGLAFCDVSASVLEKVDCAA